MKSIGGPDLLLYLVLAFGGAMFVGNLLALVRPPSKRPVAKRPVAPTAKPPVAKPPGAPVPLASAPKGRTITMMVVGAIASLWALATLLSR